MRKLPFAGVQMDSADIKAKSTSLITNVWFGERIRNYALWSIVVFFAFLTLKDVISLIVEFSKSPKNTNMDVRFNDSMTLPTITFCLSAQLIKSHHPDLRHVPGTVYYGAVDEFLSTIGSKEAFMNRSSRWSDPVIDFFVYLITGLTSTERETDPPGLVNAILRVGKAGFNKDINRLLMLMGNHSISFEELRDRVGYEYIRKHVRRIVRLNREVPSESTFRTTWISKNAYCIQPVNKDDRDIEERGPIYKLEFVHNETAINQQLADCIQVDFHGRPTKLVRFMEGKGRVEDGLVQDICHGQFHEVIAEIQGYYIMLENDDEGTACSELKVGEDTEFDCKSRCRLNMIKDLCNCIPVTLSYLSSDDEIKQLGLCKYDACKNNSVSNMVNDDKEMDCHKPCKRHCNQISYKVTSIPRGEAIVTNKTELTLSWGSFEYIALEQAYKYSTVSEFIGALGGAIGIWLGLSVLSLLQSIGFVFDYFTLRTLKVSEATVSDVNPFSSPYNQSKKKQNDSEQEMESRLGNHDA